MKRIGDEMIALQRKLADLLWWSIMARKQVEPKTKGKQANDCITKYGYGSRTRSRLGFY